MWKRTFNKLKHPLSKGDIIKINKNSTQVIEIVDVFYNLSKSFYTYKCQIIDGIDKNHTRELNSNSPNYVLEIIKLKKDTTMSVKDKKMNTEYNEIELSPEEFVLKVCNSYFNNKDKEYKSIDELMDNFYIVKHESGNYIASYSNSFRYYINIDENKFGKYIGFVPASTNTLILDKFVCFEYKKVLEIFESFHEFNYAIELKKILENDKNKNLHLGDEVYVFNIDFSFDKEEITKLVDNMPLETKFLVLKNYVENKGFVKGYITGIKINQIEKELNFGVLSFKNSITSKSKYVFSSEEFLNNKDTILHNIVNTFI